MSVDLDDRRAQLLDLRSRVLGAAHDIVEGDVDDGELSSAAGDQHLADHASEMVDRELDESLEDNAEQLVQDIDRALRKMWVRLERAAKVPALPRRAFHGVRRSWADDIEAAHGLDTVTAAGGWSRRETPEQVYVSRRKYGHLERARKRREEPES